MFLQVLNTLFLNICIYLSHHEPSICSIQIVVIMNFVVISHVDIKRVDCIVVICRITGNRYTCKVDSTAKYVFVSFVERALRKKKRIFS